MQNEQKAKSFVLSQPIGVVTIEVTTRCNLACVMCPHGLPGGMKTKSDTADELIEKVISSLDHVKAVQPTGLGEPMLAPAFWRIAEIVKKKTGRLRMRFHTNGILLSEKRVSKIAEIPIGNINVSIDAATAGTYQKIRGWDFDACIKGVKRLAVALASIDDPGRPDDYLQISCLVMSETIDELVQFVELAKTLGIRYVYFEHLVDPEGCKSDWIINRDGFVFNYAEQSLVGKPELSDASLIRAYDRAEELDINIKGVGLIQSPDLLHHEQRPCRFYGGL